MRNAVLVLMLMFALAVAAIGQSFTPTGSMHEERMQHTATLLNNGSVLVAGGIRSDAYGNPITANTAEIYNPQTGTWRYTGIGQQTTMTTPRFVHTATKLADGRVLLAGGYYALQANSGVGGYTPLPTVSAEIYDPVAETFTLTGSLSYVHTGAQAVLLNDGRVMVVGEIDSSPATPSEIFSPSLGTWSANVPALPTGYGPAVTVLTNGDVFIAAGQGCCGTLSTAALYTPATNTLRTMANLLATRAAAGAATLPNGQVLVVGGYNDSFTLSSTELYDTSASPNGQSQFGLPLNQSRRDHSTTLLPNGDVLVVGGQQGAPGVQNLYLSSAELRNYVTGAWGLSGTMSIARLAHTATLLQSGAVLVAGGSNGAATSSAEVWAGVAPSLTLTPTPTALSFNYQQGAAGTIPAKTVSVTSGGVPIAISASVSTIPPGGTWLSIPSGATMTPGNISVAVSPTLTAGAYYGSLQISSASAANSPITVPISVTVGPPAVTTGTVTIQSSPAGAYFQVSGPALTYLSGNTPFQQSGLPAGTYKITWSILLGGYQTPVSETQTLAPGGSIAFFGTYGGVTANGYLSFPLINKDPYSAEVITVFDHSMKEQDGKYRLYGTPGDSTSMDGKVLSFANEMGSASPVYQGCYPQAGGLMFFANTAYTGPRQAPPAPTFDYKSLCYENHPGIDYRVDQDTNTPVLAAATGKVFYPSSMIGLSSPSPFHVLGIKPDGQDYVIYYLHLSTYNDSPQESISTLLNNLNLPPQSAGCPGTLPLPAGTAISPGCVIGRAGGWGSLSGVGSPTAFPVHLHFEVHKIVPLSQAPTNSHYGSTFPHCPKEVPDVDWTSTVCVPVDPYGWDGPLKDNNNNPGDPYTQSTGLQNVRLWNHLPLAYSISPANTTSGTKQISLSGDGFVTGTTVVAVDGNTRNPVSTTSSISSVNSATVTGAWSSGKTYYLYVVTPDGRHSNWQKLTVSPASGGNR